MSSYSVKKPFTVIVAVILVIILGVVSFTSMQTDLLPSFDLPYVVVITTYPGASPEKVESVITKPLEQSMATVGGINQVSSQSRENASIVMLEFTQSTNLDTAVIEINSHIDIIESAWTDELIGAPMLMRISPNMLPLMIASVDMEGLDTAAISDLVDSKIIPALESVDGVATVGSVGMVDESVEISISDEKIAALNDKIFSSIDGKLDDAQAALENALAQINAGRRKLAGYRSELDANMKKVTDALAGCDVMEAKLTDTRTTLNGQVSVLKQQREDMAANGEDTTAIDSQIAALEQQISGIDSQLQKLQTQRAQLEASKAQLESAQEALDEQGQAAAAKLSSGERTVREGLAEIEQSRDSAKEEADVHNFITSDMVSGLLTAQNFSMPAGYIHDADGGDYLVKVGDSIGSMEELENLLLFELELDDVSEVRLCDVADVSLRSSSEDSYTKINGNDGVILTFQKQSTASTAAVSDALGEKIAQLTEAMPGLHITTLMDQGMYIDLVINSVIENLLLGAALAIIILIFFLRDIRPTFVIALSIPISLMFAIVMMYFTGVSINILSMAGLALGVGMLVDNSIVVIENIYRLRAMGVPVAKAAIEGARSVAGAIFASTLTTICVFMPIVFTEGLSRELFSDMGLTIAYSLLASLIVALTLVPALASGVLKRETKQHSKLFTWLQNGYVALLKLNLKAKPIVLIGSAALFVLSIGLAFTMGTALIPPMDSPQLSLTVEMPEEFTQEDANKLADEITERLLTIDDVDTVGALSTGSAASMMSSANSTSMSFYAILKDDKAHTNFELEDIILDKTSDLNCTVKVKASGMDTSALSGEGIQIEIRGNDLDTLRALAAEAGKLASGIEGVGEVDDGLSRLSSETRISVDKDKAMSEGLTVAQVYASVSSALTTEKRATTLTIGNKEYPVTVITTNDAIESPGAVEDMIITVTGTDGTEKEIRLGDIASVTEAEGYPSISRANQQRYVSVNLSVANGYNIGLVSRDLEKAFESFELPEGYTVSFGGENETINDIMGDLFIMLALAILCIYLIMVAQFQSLLSPFIVMFTIPLSFTGGLLALFVTGCDLSVMAVLGFLVLSGVVVNNGIVFIDCVNQFRAGGMSKKDALVEAGRTRLRPILMTALTTILGLSTLAFGLGMGADALQPMAIATIGGLAYATLLTLFVVPALYDILNREKKTPAKPESDAGEAAAEPTEDGANIEAPAALMSAADGESPELIVPAADGVDNK